MASKTNASTVVSSSFVDFEPYCEWKKEDDVETLIFHLSDFRRDQLKVQVNNHGALKVSGERPIDNTHKSRFLKETKTPQGCDINEVRAKFINGQLHVIMPKNVQPAPAPAPEAAPTLAQQVTESKGIPKEPKGSSSESGRIGSKTDCDDDKKSDQMIGLRNSLTRFHIGKKVNVSFGITVFAFVAIGVYAVYKCGSESSSSSSPTKAPIEE